ncbi:hypothetical protein OAH00_00955 [bacterium]|nr:hypothetical protein [bacterium]OUU85962.1 MAG: hypothetical protein CBC36_09910 [Verrucomicrobiaceae bacterium TMED76]
MENLESKNSSKMIMGFVIGLVAGVLGVLFAQYTFKESNEDQVVSTVQKSPNGITNSGPSTTTSRLSIANSSPRKDSSSIKSDTDEKDDGKEKGKEIWETIMALGEDKQKEEVSDEVDKMAERFNLTASQKSRLQELLEAKAKTQSEAGLKLFTGKASIADLIASDEDNYSEIDKAMQELLSGDQLAEYETYTEEREIERIEKKTNEDLGGLREIAGITEEQIDQARDFFIEINASEKPGSMDMTNITRDQFMGVIDDALDKRVSGVAEFLNDDQVTSYRKQVDGFRKMISAFVPDTEE